MCIRDSTKKHAKKAIELRYKLLPYNYNLAFENNQKGLPLMRPIFFEEDDKKLIENSSTYLWGKDFLITPILKDSIKTKEIYFPKTANWYNFYFDEKIQGGQTKSVKVNKNNIPTYVKGGAFILMSELIQTTDDYKADKLELHYYFDNDVKKSNRTFYNDDGLTANAFEKGNYELMKFEANHTDNYLEIDFNDKLGNKWKSTKKEVTLVIHNITWKPKKIKVGRKRVRIAPQHNKLSIPVKWNPTTELKIRITKE